jgi:hypothetical protein
MGIVTTVHSEVFEAFRDLGASEDKALKAAAALSKRDEDIADMKRDLHLLKWMVGATLTFVLAMLVKTFVH